MRLLTASERFQSVHIGSWTGNHLCCFAAVTYSFSTVMATFALLCWTLVQV